MAEHWAKKTEKKAKILKISELNKVTEDACGICLENHRRCEMIACGCSHQFGRECFRMVAETNLPKGIAMLCPLCRVPVKSFAGFRQRSAPKPRDPVPEVIAVN
jgi:hypothetical protein